MSNTNFAIKPAGYAYILNNLTLDVLPNWHTSQISSAVSNVKSQLINGILEDTYPESYWPGDSATDHLEFALKYDGVNLAYLQMIFQKLKQSDIINYIQAKPTGKYVRLIWFFYEYITQEELPIENLTKGNYFEILNPDDYYTTTSVKRIQRQRLINNLLGDTNFCPTVRRSEKLRKMETDDISSRCNKIIEKYSPELVKRALNYLYKKETKSSFAIEHINPNESRTEKFMSLLQLAEHKDFCEQESLIELQNRIVDPRFKDQDYRTSQNYVGETVSFQKEIIRYICPSPEHLPDLMAGLIKSQKIMLADDVHPIVHAAAIAYGFVFLHPFEDGNGRIHRFLIHNILALRKFTPEGLMFPVSAVMLKNMLDYDKSLEAFSNPLMQLAEYSLDDLGQMTVHNNLKPWYQYMDLTAQVEALYDFVNLTIEDELLSELEFLANYDLARNAIRNIIDMPDRLMDLLIKLCIQNNGKLSNKKKLAYFKFLTDDEVKAIEKIIKDNF